MQPASKFGLRPLLPALLNQKRNEAIRSAKECEPFTQKPPDEPSSVPARLDNEIDL